MSKTLRFRYCPFFLFAVCVSYDATKTNVDALKKALTDVKFQAEVAKQCDKEGGCKHEDEHHECKNNCEKK